MREFPDETQGIIRGDECQDDFKISSECIYFRVCLCHLKASGIQIDPSEFLQDDDSDSGNLLIFAIVSLDSHIRLRCCFHLSICRRSPYSPQQCAGISGQRLMDIHSNQVKAINNLGGNAHLHFIPFLLSRACSPWTMRYGTGIDTHRGIYWNT